MEQLDRDRALIAAMGGPARVAELLGLKKHGTQRVHNWTSRGIPAAVKLMRPDLFLIPDPTRPHPEGRPAIDVAGPAQQEARDAA
jgi:hypothetical protein